MNNNDNGNHQPLKSRSHTKAKSSDRSIIEGINAHIKELHQEHKRDWPSLGGFAAEHVFCLTVMFHDSRGIDALNEFSKVYYSIVKQLLGRQLQRYRSVQPRCFAFIDYQGSRTPGLMDVRMRSLAHVHAVLIVRPEHQKSFEAVIAAESQCCLVESVEHIKAERFCRAKQSIQGLVAYCMKGYSKTPSNYAFREEGWHIFPAEKITEQDENWQRFQRKKVLPGWPERQKANKQPAKPMTLESFPRELRGPSNNRHGGHKSNKIRGFRGGTYGAAGPCRRLSPEEIAEHEKRLCKKSRK